MANRNKVQSQKSSRPRTHRRSRPLYGPLHPWRLCPLGQHWVVEHDVHRKPTPRRPEGATFPRSSHCQRNPSHLDRLYPLEMHNMAEKFFSALVGPPALDDFEFKARGNAFDALIRGWTRYWNEIFQPSEPLDPNLVKALVATESGFNPKS